MSEEVEYEAQNNNQANQVSNPELQAQPKNLKKKEMIKKLQIEELDQENNIFEDSKQESLTRKCTKHPEEELQFYCFNKEQLLCSECLVSGKYVGLDVANLRKAAGKLREKFKKFVSDAVEKFEVYNALEEEIQSHEEGVESAVSAYEEEILKSFNQIRQKINEKEQEIVNNLLILKQERVKELKSAAVFIQNYRQEIESLKNVVEGELKTLDELSLCKYYQEKTDAMQTLLNKEIKTESIKEIIEHQQLQDQLGLSKLQEDCKAIQAQVEALSGIGTGKTKQNNKEGNKLGRVGSLFSSLENDSNTLQESRDTLLFRPSTPSRSTISHKPTYLPEDLVKATSMPSSTNNIFEKHIAKVQEIRRQTPKQDIRIDTSILAPEGKKPEARNSLMIEMKRNTVNKKYSGLSLNDSASLLDVYKEGRNKNSESKTPKTFMLSSNISPSNKTFGAELSSPNHFKSNSFLTSVTTKAADKPEKIGFDSSIRYMKLDRSLYELQNAELQRKNSAKPVARESDDSMGLNMEKMFAKRKAQERGSISSGNHTEMKKRLSNLGSSLFK